MTQPGSQSFSVRDVPESWVEAADENGPVDNSPLTKKRAVGVVPIHQDADALTGSLAALAMSVVVGTAWYAFESQDVINSPWLAVVAGALIAVAVRLGAGADHSDVRATVSLIFYIITLFVVAYFIEAFDYRQIYGSRPSFQATQTELVRDRLRQPETIFAWAIGVFVNLQTGYLLRRR